MLAEAARPYLSDLVVATKLGWEYDGSGRLLPAHTPEKLREAMERDLRLLGTDAIAIVHLRWGSDRAVTESFGLALEAMIDMREHGKFRQVGLSNVGLTQLEYALTKTPIASVSNSFSVVDQADSAIVDFTDRHGIAYLPWLPLRTGTRSKCER